MSAVVVAVMARRVMRLEVFMVVFGELVEVLCGAFEMSIESFKG